jgi:hypothetical protein
MSGRSLFQKAMEYCDIPPVVGGIVALRRA